MKENSR